LNGALRRRSARVTRARSIPAPPPCTSLEAIGIGPGDQVLVPTLTFTATAEVIRYLGADPVFVGVDYRTGLLTPEILNEALTRQPGIKAVMVVHFGGQAAQMTEGGAQGNEAVNTLYRRVGWKMESTYATPQGRIMNRYIYDFAPLEAANQ
jgi:hypothetical protein